MQEAVTSLELPGVPHFRSGKVRETFDLGDRLLMVATDRVSTFDIVLPTGIPARGIILTQFSRFWFERLTEIIPNHLITTGLDDLPPHIQRYNHLLKDRTMIARKADRIDIECVARGYISGSAWSSYLQDGTFCGHQLPSGLQESDKLSEPIFTPTTKASSGHDEPITIQQMVDMVGLELTRKLEDLTLQLYAFAEAFCRERGIILADTKFEFGFINDELCLIDEVFTPDSSRFWDASQYEPGHAQPSYDKQILRDWLIQSGWYREPPAPELPPDVALGAAQRYYEVFQRLTGETLEIDLSGN
ncbi:MAG: phosphoribosylaminoimidazolesuccinocarboxamide synthase [Thermomicrobiaceae bacterium]